MKTINELQKEIGGTIQSMFDYKVNKDRRYKSIFLNEPPTVEQVWLCNQAGYKLVAQILNVNEGDRFVRKIVYETIPVNGQYELE